MTDDGRRIWRRIWRYAAAWLSVGTDAEIVTRYVENLELRARIVAALDGDMMATGFNGQVVLHPLMRQLNYTERLLLQLEQRLGFTPADRSRIGATEVRAATSLDTLNARREQRQREREKLRRDSVSDDSAPS